MRNWNDLRHLYLTENLSTLEIARIKKVQPPTVLYHLKRQGIATKPRNWRRMKLLPNHPSPSFSYIIGALFGDGWISKNFQSPRIQLRVKSKQFADCFARNINACGFSSRVKQRNDGYWVATAKSIQFCRWWHSTDDFQILDIALTYPREFICGFFDAEGSVFIRKTEKKPRIAIDCGNSLAMMGVLSVLKANAFNCTTNVSQTSHGTTIFRIFYSVHRACSTLFA